MGSRLEFPGIESYWDRGVFMPLAPWLGSFPLGVVTDNEPVTQSSADDCEPVTSLLLLIMRTPGRTLFQVGLEMKNLHKILPVVQGRHYTNRQSYNHRWP